MFLPTERSETQEVLDGAVSCQCKCGRDSALAAELSTRVCRSQQFGFASPPRSSIREPRRPEHTYEDNLKCYVFNALPQEVKNLNLHPLKDVDFALTKKPSAPDTQVKDKFNKACQTLNLECRSVCAKKQVKVFFPDFHVNGNADQELRKEQLEEQQNMLPAGLDNSLFDEGFEQDSASASGRSSNWDHLHQNDDDV